MKSRALLFGGWILVGLALSTATHAADVDNGEDLYLKYCRGCHGEDGRGGAHTFMPHIENLTKKGYIDLLPDQHLHGVIKNGGPSVGMSSYMPAWGSKLSDAEIADIIAHIRSLPTY